MCRFHGFGAITMAQAAITEMEEKQEKRMKKNCD